jgi:hypothetical protein
LNFNNARMGHATHHDRAMLFRGMSMKSSPENE